jgi:3-isopropylmalate/(R)-2-methylmalate dehydratase large subunit
MPQRSPKDMSSNLPPRTLFEKVWDAHVVKPETPDAPAVFYYLLGEAEAITAFERARGER